MTRILLAAAFTLVAAPACFSQMAGMNMPAPPASTGPASEVQRSYNSLKPNVLKAAEKMPEADFQYKPTPEIRTYARIINHITEAQSHTCTTLLGTAFDKAMVPSDTADKAIVLAGLKASFELCDKAYATLTNDNLAEMLSMGPIKRSRIGLAWGNVSHDNEQYAELSTYLRLKNLIPPTAEK